MSITDINFWSEKNYLKRDSSSGSTSIAAPVTSAYSGTIYITQYVVQHTLGITPYSKVYYEPFLDEVIWEATGTRLGENILNPRNTDQTGPYCISWSDQNSLTIEIGYSSNTLTGSYPIYWLIYKDYDIT